MPEYRVDLKASAQKELDKLPLSILPRVFTRIESLTSEPRPSGCKKLKGGHDEWRLRVGDYRVVYTIDDKKLRVTVTRIRHRSEVYEN